MHDHKISVYVVDPLYQPSQEQKDKAVELFDSIIPEGDQLACGESNVSITLEDGTEVVATFALTAAHFAGSNKHWVVDEDEHPEDSDEEDYDELDFGTELRPDVLAQLEEILGTELAVIWEWGE